VARDLAAQPGFVMRVLDTPLSYFPHVADPIWREFPLTAAAETRPLRRRAGRELGAVDP
jgi:hypothetical protein